MRDAPRPLPGGGWFAIEEGEARPVSAPPRAPTRSHSLPREAEEARRPRTPAGLAALHLSLGGVALALPAALTERILPMPALRPCPGGLPGVLGLAEAGGAPALVLDASAILGSARAARPAHLVVLQFGGRRLALPAERVEAGPAIAALGIFETWLASPEAAPALTAAPLARPPAPPQPVAERTFLVFSAGGITAAFPTEAVAAVLAPQRPLPAPPWATPGLAGLVAHRGAVLPVRDGGLALGGPAVLAAGEAPLIRLALRPEWLLAVAQVQGVRRVPASEVLPAGGGLIAAIARLGAEPLPVLAAARLAA
jgi:chemotaxis signal transduction protein